MLYIREFEIVEDEGGFLAVPLDMEGGTEGPTREDAVAVAVDVDLADAPAMTASQAAAMLGVSTARIAQMCSSGQLASWKIGSTRMVAQESVEERLVRTPKPGRLPSCTREAALA